MSRSRWSPYPRSSAFDPLRLLEGSAALLVLGANVAHALGHAEDFDPNDCFGSVQQFCRWKPPDSRLRRYALGFAGLPLFLPFYLLDR